jgi:hypothetical protein
LKDAGAAWTDSPDAHLNFHFPKKVELYSDLRKWSDFYNQFDNWTRLSVLIALSANLETYMASVISLALESDPGLLLGLSQRVDGVAILKHGASTLEVTSQVTDCTKGDWQSRGSAFGTIFGSVPPSLTLHLSELERIRNLRNKVSHAFGRDIDKARKHGVKDIIPMETLRFETANKYRSLIWSVAKSIDVQLLQHHIGEFQAIRFYHELYPRLRKDIHPHDRAVLFKKEVGRFKAQSVGKLFSYGLVDYYESL